MPEIPQYGGRQVRTAPLAAPQQSINIASPEAFGAGLADGFSRGHIAIAKTNKEEADKRDETNALDALNAYMDRRNKDMAGYLNRTGKNAIGLSDEAQTGHSKTRDEIAATLKDAGAKQLFNTMATRRWTEESRTVQGHMVGQIKDYQISTYEGNIQRIEQDGHASASRFTLPEQRNLANAEIEKAASLQFVTRQRLADLVGEEPDHRKDQTRLFGGHVQSLLEREDYEGAKAYYEANKDRIHGPAKDDLGNKVKNAGKVDEARRSTKAIMDDPNQTLERASKMASVIKDTDVYNLTMQNIHRVLAERKQVKAEKQNAAYEDFALRVEKGESLSDIAAKDGDFTVLDQRDRDNLQSIEQNYINKVVTPPLSDTFYSLRNMASELPGEFMAHDFRKDRGQITENERGQLMELQADMKARTNTKSATGAAKPVRGLLSVEDVANNAMRSVNIRTDVKDGLFVDKRAPNFMRLFDKAINANGGTEALNSQQMEKIADKILLESAMPDKASTAGQIMGYTPVGWIFGAGKDGTKQVRAMDLPNAEKMAFSVAQIPAANRVKGINALTQANESDIVRAAESFSRSAKGGFATGAVFGAAGEAMRQATEELRKAGVFDPTEDELIEYYNASLAESK